MTRVNIICEGETEAAFVKEMLAHYFLPLGVYLNPIPMRRGDSYDKFRDIVLRTMASDPDAWHTSMIE